MSPHHLLTYLVVYCTAAVIFVPLFKRLGLGSVLGYLAAGALIGPSGLGLFQDVQAIMGFAELGVVMLLFVIGLELKPNRLWVMRRAIFGLGIAQMALTTLALSVVGVALGQTWTVSLLAGLGLSLSSTAFALQILAEKNQVNTVHGRASFAILLFQDMAVIPILALLPVLVGGESRGAESYLLSTLKSGTVIALIIFGGRYLLRPLFRLVASTGLKEVFTSAALLVVVGTAALMELVGLSMALGTFLAGMLLADSEYRHEIETDIDPFKGLLLGLFFMGVGMSVDYGLILQRPLEVFGLSFGLLVVKYSVTYGIGKAAKFSSETARGMASVLPQGGEFAYVLFGSAAASAAIPTAISDLLMLVITFSMALTPVLLTVNQRFFSRKFECQKQKPFDTIPNEDAPVIIAGFGRFGQIAGRILRAQGVRLTALEQDPEQVQAVRRFGNEIYYGDASRIDLLETAGARKAKAFVLAIDDVEGSVKTARVVRQHFPDLRIFARARNRDHAFALMELGVELIYRETLGSSLEMAESVLISLGTERGRAKSIVEKFRQHDQDLLLKQFAVHKDESEMINQSKQAAQQLVEILKADIS